MIRVLSFFMIRDLRLWDKRVRLWGFYNKLEAMGDFGVSSGLKFRV